MWNWWKWKAWLTAGKGSRQGKDVNKEGINWKYSGKREKRFSGMRIADTDPDNINNITNWDFSDHDGIKQSLQNGIHSGRNPYCFQCGEIVVEVEYASDGSDLFQLIKGIAQREKAKESLSWKK